MPDDLLYTPDDVDVTATPQAVSLEYGATYTLRNTGDQSLYYIHKPGTYSQSSTSFAGTATELKAAGGTEIPSGIAKTVSSAPPWIHVACATGLTTTLKIDAGEGGYHD